MGNSFQSIITNTAITNQVTISPSTILNQAVLPVQTNQDSSLGGAILMNAILPRCCNQAPTEEIPPPIVPIEVPRYEPPVEPELPPIEAVAEPEPEPAKPKVHHRPKAKPKHTHKPKPKPQRKCVEWETKK